MHVDDGVDAALGGGVDRVVDALHVGLVELAPLRLERRPRDDEAHDARTRRRPSGPSRRRWAAASAGSGVGLVVVAERVEVGAPQQDLAPRRRRR